MQGILNLYENFTFTSVFFTSISLDSNNQLSGSPLPRENRENGIENSLSGKSQRIWKFCLNTRKTKDVLFAHVVNSLILRMHDITIFAVKLK